MSQILKRALRKALMPYLCNMRTDEFGLGRVHWSQFGEDIAVTEFFSGTTGGVYLDVGCFHPIYLSNTYALYRNGWSGVAIDPNPELKPLFQKFRSRDKFIQAASGTRAGTLKYRRFKNGAVNRLEGAEIPDEYSSEEIESIHVNVRPISDLLRELKIEKLDFLNIDCEGEDLDALRSLDLTEFRPALIAIEDHTSEWIASPTATYLSGHNYNLVGRYGLTSLYRRG